MILVSLAEFRLAGDTDVVRLGVEDCSFSLHSRTGWILPVTWLICIYMARAR